MQKFLSSISRNPRYGHYSRAASQLPVGLTGQNKVQERSGKNDIHDTDFGQAVTESRKISFVYVFQYLYECLLYNIGVYSSGTH